MRCDFQNFPADVKQKASIYVPAIGKVTIVVLLRNLLRIVQNKQARVAKTHTTTTDATQTEGDDKAS